MAENSTPSGVDVNPPPPPLDEVAGNDLAAGTLVDLVWNSGDGQAVTSESAWQAIHTRMNAAGVANEWTEYAATKGLEVTLVAYDVGKKGEPTIATVRAALLAKGSNTGDYKRFSAIVAAAKQRYNAALQASIQKQKPYFSPQPEPAPNPAAAEPRKATHQDKTAVEENQAEPSRGLISFDLSERQLATQELRLQTQHQSALQDQRNSFQVALNAMEQTQKAQKATIWVLVGISAVAVLVAGLALTAATFIYLRPITPATIPTSEPARTPIAPSTPSMPVDTPPANLTPAPTTTPPPPTAVQPAPADPPASTPEPAGHTTPP